VVQGHPKSRTGVGWCHVVPLDTNYFHNFHLFCVLSARRAASRSWLFHVLQCQRAAQLARLVPFQLFMTKLRVNCFSELTDMRDFEVWFL